MEIIHKTKNIHDLLSAMTVGDLDPAHGLGDLQCLNEGSFVDKQVVALGLTRC